MIKELKRLLVFGVIGVFLLSGCDEIKELYGIQTSAEEEYVPLEEIKIEGEDELPPSPPGEEIPGEEIEVEEEETTEEGEEETKGVKEGAKVIIAKETDLVSLKPKAADPDADELSFTYTTPLDENGKWQTDYGDAGEYTVTITASDGELSVTKDVLIIVNKREESPVIDEAIPAEETLRAKENSRMEFKVKASDLNKDPLTYSWKLDNEGAAAEESYTYNIGYDSAGQHTIRIEVTDGVKSASRTWALLVENVNRKPVLEQLADIQVKETETIVLEPKASDDDGNELTFNVDSEMFKKKGERFEWETTYDDSGEYTVRVSASDGEDEASQQVKIKVSNVNRAPIIEDIIIG